MNRFIDQEWSFERSKEHDRCYYVVQKQQSRYVCGGIKRRTDAAAIAAAPRMLRALRRAYFLTSKADAQPHELRAALADGIDAAQNVKS